eukprot:11214777-Lingulodinium_polyedra.AAC.1
MIMWVAVVAREYARVTCNVPHSYIPTSRIHGTSECEERSRCYVISVSISVPRQTYALGKLSCHGGVRVVLTPDKWITQARAILAILRCSAKRR